jgi:hypothetical protein
VDPAGTRSDGRPIQPEEDHTVEGSLCFVTGNGAPGGPAGEADIDGGCTTLTSPAFDLAGEEEAWLSYFRWFGEGQVPQDDTLSIEVTSDGGVTWTALERVSVPDTVWTGVSFPLHEAIDLTDRVRLRVRGCDLGAPTLVEAGLDDVSLQTFTPVPPVPPGSGIALLGAAPNPGGTAFRLRVRLDREAGVRIGIFDAAGRRLRTLEAGPLGPGEHEVPWDGRAADGSRLPAGVYYSRLEAGGVERSAKLTILR